ncbi:MAG: serine/threonine protein kinase [Deltaproteobacteria bacterium]|nr:serine/threonine protein kinase [Deltaproteobacteria bacterium]
MAIDYAELGVEPGKIIAEKYRLVQLLGRGGMGSVWRSDHLELMSPVALKIIKPGLARNKNSLGRFMREAKAAARLRSPHVVQILEFGSEGIIAYIAMELMEGETLYARLRREGILSPGLTARVLTHIGRAMAKAHEGGITHRDLKPDNVFLVLNDDEIMAKVLDFGVAKSAAWSLEAAGESPETQTGTLLGTPYYMSPEQATGSKTVDHRSDLWAIGVMAFECLLGIRPYQSNALGDLVLKICAERQPRPSDFGTVPAGFDEWFARANHRKLEHRFQSAKEMTKALRDVLLAPGQAVTGSLDTEPATTRMPAVGAPAAGPETMPDPSVDEDGDGQGPLTVTQDSSSGLPRDAMPFGASSPSQPDAPPGVDSGSKIAATPFDPPSDSAADASPNGVEAAHAPTGGLETLDPLAATSVPRRNTWLLGAAVAIVLAGLIAFVATRLLSGDRQPRTEETTTSAPSPAASTAAATDGPPSAEAPSPSPTPSASGVASGVATATASTTASAAPPGLRPPTPGKTPKPPPGQAQPPKTSKPPDDPLGI